MHTPANNLPPAIRVIGGAFPDAKLIAVGTHAGLPPVSLDRPLTLIGAGRAVHVRLRSRTVSRMHAMILNADGRLLIRDLASRLHVHVNGQAVDQAELHDGDTIRIGCVEFVLSTGDLPSGGQHLAPIASGASLRADGAAPVSLNGSPFIIGRAPRSDLLILRPEVGRAHALLFEVNGRRFLRDLGSRTGVRLNGVAVQSAGIDDRDVIEIAGQEFQLLYDPAEARGDSPPTTPDARASDDAGTDLSIIEIDDHPEIDADVFVEWPAPATANATLELESPACRSAAPPPAPKPRLELAPDALDRIREWGPLATALAMQSSNTAEPEAEDVAAPPAPLPRRRWRLLAVLLVAACGLGAAAWYAFMH